MFRLVAMAPSGDVFISQLENGRFWLHLPHSVRGGGPLERADVDRIVLNASLDLVDLTFNTWKELDAARLRRAADGVVEVVHDADEWTAYDAQQAVETVDEWIAGGDLESVGALCRQLLALDVVRHDDALYTAVLDRMPAHRFEWTSVFTFVGDTDREVVARAVANLAVAA